MGEAPAYPPQSAGARMVSSVPVAREEATVGEVLGLIVAPDSPRWDALTYTLVLDDEGRLVGLVTIEQLSNTPPDTQLSAVMRRDVASVAPEADQEEAVRVAISRGLDAVPVVEADGEVLGAIDEDAILRILHEEHVEDMLLQSGVRPEPGFDIAGATAPQLVRRRLPWLVVGLAGGMLATEVVRGFEATLQRRLELAFFIPVIVYMADAVATQTETIFIRSMATGSLDVRRYVVREQGIGALIALASAALMAAFAQLRFGEPRISAIVGLSMLASIFAGVSIAVLIPWALARLGKDPAYGAGPFATIVQDVLSIVIYFVVATAVLFAAA
ncbi:MAG: magnesium transporter [Coriobacteriia bacterium]|nr:magnesium transporter [Coriobacteriia bacterium]